MAQYEGHVRKLFDAALTEPADGELRELLASAWECGWRYAQAERTQAGLAMDAVPLDRRDHDVRLLAARGKEKG